MKSLITGAKGQLGYDIIRELEKRGFDEIITTDCENMDITNADQVNEIITECKPEVIFHCAAWTAVDKAEELVEDAFKVNVEGTKNIVNAAKAVGAKLFYISTDYVFDGIKDGIYEIDDIPNPQNVYGESKYQGELSAGEYDQSFIVRISWVFGVNGNNFIKTMLNLANTRNELNIIADQYGSPTYSVDIANLLVDMAMTTKYGIYQATNEGYCSWADLAKYVFEINGLDVKVNEIPAVDYPTPAKRPMNSRMSKESLTANGFELLPGWEDAVNRYNEELKEVRKGKER